MQSYPQTHNAGADLEPHGGIAHTALTAAGGGDNAEVLGSVIDRMAPGIKGSICAVVTLKAKAAIAASESLVVTSKLRHGDDSDGSTGWADYVPPPLDGKQGYSLTTGIYTETLADAAVGVDSLAEETVYQHNFDLSGAARYVRHAVTPNLSRSGTDTATVSSTVLLAGRTSSAA
jgi:hypothetical protein